MTITFVTSFYDIGRKTEDKQNNFNNYFPSMEELLKLPINLYFFTTREIHDKLVYQHRSSLIFNFTDNIPYFDRLEEIKETFVNFKTNNPEKDTHEFATLTHAKFVLIQKAIEINPFDSSHYAWIDAGIIKVATDIHLLPDLKLTEKIKCLLIQYVSKEDTKNLSFVDMCRYKVAGGFFVGPKSLIRVFCYRMMALAEYYIYQKRFGLEQEFMTVIYKSYPELFDPYYGDFRDLFLNYETCQRNLYLSDIIFADAVRHDDREEATKVANYLLASPLIDEVKRENLLKYLNN